MIDLIFAGVVIFGLGLIIGYHFSKSKQLKLQIKNTELLIESVKKQINELNN